MYSKPAEDLSVLLIDDVLLGLGEVPASATKIVPRPRFTSDFLSRKASCPRTRSCRSAQTIGSQRNPQIERRPLSTMTLMATLRHSAERQRKRRSLRH